MYTSKIEKRERKSEKLMLFADAENYVIPAKEGWNEGYSSANKFLYINDTGVQKSNIKAVLA